MILGWSPFQVFFWPGGGWIGLVLWGLSVVMISLIIQNLLIIRRMNLLPEAIREQVKNYFANKQYREAIELTAAEPSMFSQIIHASLSEAKYGYAAMERAMEVSAEERVTKLLRSAEWLNLLGNIGPMVGLMGTVWGLILTFFAIVDSGGIPDPSKLAQAIGIKLVCTLLGLVVAIPSLAAYGSMRNRIDGLSAETLRAAQDLISNFRPGKTAAAPAAHHASPAAAPAASQPPTQQA